MRKELVWLFCLFLLWVSTSLHAGLVVIDDNLHGIDGLNIGGTYYNVDFVGGSFQSAYVNVGITPTFWDDANGSLEAAVAILTAINGDGTYANAPLSINGCHVPSGLCGIAIPKSGWDFPVGASYLADTVVIHGLSSNNIGETGDNYLMNHKALTYFEVSTVPLPATVWLFLSGLGGLFLVSSKQK